MEIVSADDVKNLLNHFSKTPFRVQDIKSEETLIKCKALFSKDYKYSTIDNHNGEIVTTYPAELIIPEDNISNIPRDETDTCDTSNSLVDSFCDVTKLRDLIVKARVARCRARFPLPVIYFEGRYVCRSATLSGGPEIYGRSGYDFFFAGNSDVVADDEDLKEIPIPQSSSEWQLFSKVRTQDIRLLKALSVGYICDLMVEKKKVKFGMNVTSSEKVDKENRYNDFTILSLPYPGCEFFRDYRDNEYNGEGLVFDWTQGFVDAQIGVPNDTVTAQLGVDWVGYKSWDLVRLTQNYLKLLLKYLIEGTSGLLIHCISGWDRTPLFVSLLRISLWADGKAHPSLSATEIIYLTIAYDWYLFGHDLPDRLSKGEEIFFFCFYFLKFLISEEFSVYTLKSNNATRNGSDCHLDGILLEEDPVKTRGSNTSLNSSCSSVSSRSQDNNPPVYFTTQLQEQWDEGLVHSNGNIPSSHQFSWTSRSPKLEDLPSTPPTLTNSSEAGVFTNGNSPSVQALAAQRLSPALSGYSSTSPVAVPNSVRQRSESSSSVGCGSWQIISGTGSIRGSASTRSSLSSPTLEINQNSENTKKLLCQEMSETRDKSSPSSSWSRLQLRDFRNDRLQAVRSIFYHTYLAAVTGKGKNGTEHRGISNLLDHFAEKVGFRCARTTTV